MANIIREQRLIDNNKRSLLKYVVLADTALANSTIVDVSTLQYALNTSGYIMTANTNPKGNYRTTIKRVFGSAKANAYFSIAWQTNGTNNEIITIPTGQFDYNFDYSGDGAVISNPTVATSNGDILLNIITPGSADTLTLFIDLRKDSQDYSAGQEADPIAFNKGRAAFG